VHALELSEATAKIEVATIKGEVATLRSVSATSEQVRATAEVLTLKLDTLHRDVAGIKTIMFWTAGIILTGVIGAGLKVILIP
jgi:hypothetical protein